MGAAPGCWLAAGGARFPPPPPPPPPRRPKGPGPGRYRAPKPEARSAPGAPAATLPGARIQRPRGARSVAKCYGVVVQWPYNQLHLLADPSQRPCPRPPTEVSPTGPSRARSMDQRRAMPSAAAGRAAEESLIMGGCVPGARSRHLQCCPFCCLRGIPAARHYPQGTPRGGGGGGGLGGGGTPKERGGADNGGGW
jgi:hypothetical protein